MYYTRFLLSLSPKTDGKTTIADVTALVNIIFGKDTKGQFNRNAAAVNQDTEITIADITSLVNVILGEKQLAYFRL